MNSLFLYKIITINNGDAQNTVYVVFFESILTKVVSSVLRSELNEMQSAHLTHTHTPVISFTFDYLTVCDISGKSELWKCVSRASRFSRATATAWIYTPLSGLSCVDRRVIIFLKHLTMHSRTSPTDTWSGIRCRSTARDKSPHVSNRAAQSRDKVSETRAHSLCSLHHSILIPNLGLDYTTVIYTIMRFKGNAVAIRLHFGTALSPVTLKQGEQVECKGI